MRISIHNWDFQHATKLYLTISFILFWMDIVSNFYLIIVILFKNKFSSLYFKEELELFVSKLENLILNILLN